MEDFATRAGNQDRDCESPRPSDRANRTRNVEETESRLTGNTFAIVNQKGGVGKTTTAINLSAALASIGHRILLLDLDPQGNSTSGVGVQRAGLTMSIYDVLVGGDPMFHAIRPTAVERLDLVPSDVRLAGAEVELVPTIAREAKLRNALRAVREMYDVLLIDCPPSLGLLTINALTAADGCMIPMQCEYYAMEGLTALSTTIELVKRHLNPDLAIAGVILTMTDQRTRLSEQVATEVRRHFGERVFASAIPRSVRLAEAPSYGQPVLHYASDSKGAEAYRSLAREVEERIGLAPTRTGTGRDESAVLAAASYEPGGDDRDD